MRIKSVTVTLMLVFAVQDSFSVDKKIQFTLPDKQIAALKKAKRKEITDALELKCDSIKEKIGDTRGRNRKVLLIQRRRIQARIKLAGKPGTPILSIGFHALKIGNWGYVKTDNDQWVEVMQVINEREFIGISVSVVNRVVRTSPLILRPSLVKDKLLRWYKGFDTTGYVDGNKVSLDGFFIIRESKKYSTRIGTSTVPLVEAIQPKPQ